MIRFPLRDVSRLSSPGVPYTIVLRYVDSLYESSFAMIVLTSGVDVSIDWLFSSPVFGWLSTT